jgi:hypothetical protein
MPISFVVSACEKLGCYQAIFGSLRDCFVNGLFRSYLEFPPNQSKVLAAFTRWYEDWRKTKLRIESEPDKQDRRSRTCDYVLAGENDQRIAVEVSTAWRSEAAPKEDKGWSRVWEECERRLNGRVKGTYHIYVPPRWPKNLPADDFCFGLLEAIEGYKEPENADKPVQMMQVCGVPVAASRFMREGSSVSFARFWSESEGEDMSAFIQRILKTHRR